MPEGGLFPVVTFVAFLNLHHNLLEFFSLSLTIVAICRILLAEVRKLTLEMQFFIHELHRKKRCRARATPSSDAPRIQVKE